MPYVSKGPQLFIEFVSDGVSDAATRGFKLLILYGVTAREVEIKIHEATKPIPRKENYNHLLIAIIGALAVVVLVIVTFVVILLLRNKNNTDLSSRNIFGVRRNSGISHSRRSRSSDEHLPNEQNQLPQRRSERTVQRSNSQLNWMARAELTTTIQKSGCTPRPNAYTASNVLTNVAARSSRMPSTTACNAVTSFARPNIHATRSYEDNLDEYSETVDSLRHMPGTKPVLNGTRLHGCQLPSYEESCPEKCKAQRPMNSQNCYENLSSNAKARKSHPESQTNIYINTEVASGSSVYINGVAIDATSCIIKSECHGNLSANAFDDKPAANAEPCNTKMVVYQNAPMNTRKKGSRPSSSSVQIVDGYAFIVPSQFNTTSLDNAHQLTETRDTHCQQ